MILSVLPTEARTDLSGTYPGVAVVWRPLDVLEKSQWFDAYPDLMSREARTFLVQRQILRIDGLQVEEPVLDSDGKPAMENDVPKVVRVAFDPTKPAHLAAIPFTMITPVSLDIIERASLNEGERKN